MKPPRSPRVLRLLDALEAVYTSDSSTPAEKLEASRLAAAILSGKRKTAGRRKRKPAVKTGADLAPARPLETPAKSNPDDILKHFRERK
jgi:hypothetical protein